MILELPPLILDVVSKEIYDCAWTNPSMHSAMTESTRPNGIDTVVKPLVGTGTPPDGGQGEPGMTSCCGTRYKVFPLAPPPGGGTVTCTMASLSTSATANNSRGLLDDAVEKSTEMRWDPPPETGLGAGLEGKL